MGAVWEWLTGSSAANLGQFVGSVLTAASVTLALYIIIRDKTRASLKQADRIITVVAPKSTHPDKPSAAVTIINSSDQPIFSSRVFGVAPVFKRVRYNLSSDTRDHYREPVPLFEPFSVSLSADIQELAPDDRISETIGTRPFEGPWLIDWWLTFVDASGKKRAKHMLTGRYARRTEFGQKLLLHQIKTLSSQLKRAEAEVQESRKRVQEIVADFRKQSMDNEAIEEQLGVSLDKLDDSLRGDRGGSDQATE